MKILFFTGAGVSAESGVSTFRDNNGLWENYKIEDVATPQAWNKNQKLVLDFYNHRRKQLKEVEPNKAHQLIAQLEKEHEVIVVTQNVDNLHERAGSSNVIHLHGELTKVRSTSDPSLICDWTEDLNVGDLCAKGSQLRPHIVWFGESLNNQHIEIAIEAAENADICVIIGTSLQVYPANQIPEYVKKETIIYIIDPNLDDFQKSFYNHTDIKFIKEIASVGMEKVIKVLRF